MAYDEKVRKIEKEQGWTLDDAADCGCNMREEPCDRCWNLGWAIGGIEHKPKSKESK